MEAYNNLATIQILKGNHQIATEFLKIATKILKKISEKNKKLDSYLEERIRYNLDLCSLFLNEKNESQKKISRLFFQTQKKRKNMVFFVTQSAYKFEEIKKLVGKKNGWKIKQAYLSFGEENFGENFGEKISLISEKKIEYASQIINFDCLLETAYIKVYDQENNVIIELTTNSFLKYGFFLFLVFIFLFLFLFIFIYFYLF